MRFNYLVLAAALLVAFALVVVEAQAQSPLATVDLAVLGLSNADVTPVDADGNPATQEWLAVSRDTNAYRVIAQRASVCQGPWFNPRTALFSSVAVVRLGARDVLLVRGFGDPVLRLVSLDVPPCW